MFERILLPLDGSPTAEAVLSQVTAILRRQDSEILLLRVSPSPVTIRGQSGPFVGEERGIAECYVNDLARRLIEEGIRVRALVEDGVPAQAILDVAARERSTLIAMSTHGRTGLGRWVFGSIAEKILRASPVPVLVIRSFRGDSSPIPLAPIPFRTVLVPIASGFLPIVPFVKEFAQLFQSRILFLHVVEGSGATDPKTRAELDRVADDARRTGVSSGILERTGDPAEEILKACDEQRAELIAMSTHGREGLSRWALGSVTEKVLRGAPVPMLVVRS